MLRGAKIDCVQNIVPVGGPDTVQHMLSVPVTVTMATPVIVTAVAAGASIEKAIFMHRGPRLWLRRMHAHMDVRTQVQCPTV